MGQVTSRREAKAHDRVARLEEREHHGPVRLRSGVRLDVGEAAAEQFPGSLDGQSLDRVGGRAALIIAAAGIALSIFVGEDRSLRFEDRLADDILGRDQFDLRLLAAKFGMDRIVDSRVVLSEPAGEKTTRNAVTLVLVEVGGSGQQSLSCI